MKHRIPEGQYGRTLSNITVLFAGILLVAFIWHFQQILGIVGKLLHVAAPFLIGFAVAFLLLPVCRRLEAFFNRFVFRRKAHPRLSRVIATILGFAFLLALLAGFFSILVPQLSRSIKSVIQLLVTFANSHTDQINDLLVKYNILSIEGEQIVIAWDNIVSQAMNYTHVVFDYMLTISGGIYTLLFQFLVGLIAAFYMLMDRERFGLQVKKLCYALFSRSTCRLLIEWTRRAHGIFAGFVTGKILDSMIIGVITYIGMLIMRIEYALLISVIVGLTNIIPFFGPFFGAVPGVIILLLINPLHALYFVIFVVVLQQVDGNVIGPFILGDHVGLNAFWVMTAILTGGGLFGFLGMLLSVPVFALFYAIARTWVDYRLKKRALPVNSRFYEKAPENIGEEET